MKSLIGIWLIFAAWASAAGLEFTSTHNEVKAPSDVATVTSSYSFTNKSDSPVTIAKADPSCSCLKVEVSGGKLKYAPGESGVIRITFEMGNFSGTVDKALAVFLDKDPPEKPSIVLTLQVHIPTLITLEPKTLRWDLDGNPEPKTLEILIADGQTINVTGVKSSSESFKYDLKTLEAGKKYSIVVTPVATNAPSIGILRIETDSKTPRYRVQQAFTQIMKSAPAP
jgi:hypothetical protein